MMMIGSAGRSTDNWEIIGIDEQVYWLQEFSRIQDFVESSLAYPLFQVFILKKIFCG